ncbi:MAG: thermonuclease family protein [Alphaproteobacteria bacterium]
MASGPAPASAAEAAKAPTVKGTAVVLDGKTIEIGGRKIRLYGIDAPNPNQTCWYDRGEFPCGRYAKQTLGLNTMDQELVCHQRSIDAKGRIHAVCYDGKGQDVARNLLKHGWSTVDQALTKGDTTQNKTIKEYFSAEVEARRLKLGLWNFKFTRPHKWRSMMGIVD